ncbi:MAG: preprotein translocase subunit SecE, partial [Gammaproteobacteria bacterium]
SSGLQNRRLGVRFPPGLPSQGVDPGNLGLAVLEVIKQILVVVALGAGFGGFFYFSEAEKLYAYGSLVAALVVAIVIGIQTQPGAQLWKFLTDARTEVRKVIWPAPKETTQMTFFVFVITVLTSLMLWFFDWMSSTAVEQLLGIGG